ncbi:MAG: N-acetylmuramoyl-L-alanine amidase [Paramuribaculum sp.]|nr:N-acetylmuramoyl-L-alanine amidase [Paramuribaculum sp.]
MRKITHIVVHCSAGNQRNSAEDIVRYHTTPKPRGNGWKTPGYHYIVEADGRVINIVPVTQPSNGVAGHNSHIINVCYIGGVDTSKPGLPPVDNRTPEQKSALKRLLEGLKQYFPDAEIVGHRDFNPKKACPSFDARKEYAGL